MVSTSCTTPPIPGSVDAIAISGSDVYVGGSFDQARTSASIKTPASRIARWNGSSWSALGDAANVNNNGVHYLVQNDNDTFTDFAAVDALVFNGNGDLYVGGKFTRANSDALSNTNASNIAKWKWQQLVGSRRRVGCP